ncbi:MAG TPA: RDD family protein [Flavitalea sp.]|nr:RDD family protein [Flavitalea sp.]
MQYENAQVEEIFQFEDYHVRASSGKRFLNYLIDVVMFYLLIVIVGIVLGIMSPAVVEYLDSDDSTFGLIDRIVTLFLYAGYMGFCEMMFKGKSVGKMITGCRAVNLDGSTITGKTAFLRGLSRAVPFASFSAFGDPCNPWQDRWTDSMVVNDLK